MGDLSMLETFGQVRLGQRLRDRNHPARHRGAAEGEAPPSRLDSAPFAADVHDGVAW